VRYTSRCANALFDIGLTTSFKTLLTRLRPPFVPSTYSQRDIGYSITITEMAKKRGLEARKGTRRSERVAKRSKVEAADLTVHTDPTTALTAAVAVAIAGPALLIAITEPMQEIVPVHMVVDKSTEKGFMEDTADVAANGST
jgi:hypothetical protein